MRIFLAFNCFLLIIFINPYFSIAQLTYQDGFIITQKGDTLIGSIGINQLNIDYKHCYFKEVNSHKIFKYTPEDLNAYCIPTSLFFISIEDSKRKSKSQTFLKVLVRGEISLIEQQSGFLLEHDGETIVLGNDYKKVLGDLMRDCKALEYDILLAKKETSKLTEIVSFYNDFKGSETENYHFQRKDIFIIPSIGFGVVSSQLNSKITTKDGKESFDYSQSQQLRAGFALELIITKFSKSFSFQVGSFYNNHEFIIDFMEEFKPRYSVYPAYFIYEQTKLSYSTIEIPLSVKYSIPTGNWNLYVNTGISNRIVLDADLNSQIEKQTENVIETNPYANGASVRKNQQAIFIGGGFERLLLKRWVFGMELNASTGNSIYRSKNADYDVHSSTKSLITTFFLKF